MRMLSTNGQSVPATTMTLRRPSPLKAKENLVRGIKRERGGVIKIPSLKSSRKCFYCLKPSHGIKQCRLKAAAKRHCKEWKKEKEKGKDSKQNAESANFATGVIIGDGSCEEALVAMAGAMDLDDTLSTDDNTVYPSEEALVAMARSSVQS